LRWRQDSRVQRRLLLGTYSVLLLAVAGGTAAVAVTLLSSHGGSADHLAEVGDAFAGGTLLLALLAGAVAVQAYAYASGLPRLMFQVQFEFSEPNKPVFQAELEDNGWTKARDFKQTTGRVILRNVSAYSARNPAVVARLHGMAFLGQGNSMRKNWTTIVFVNTVGATAIQWDGGPAYSIHGHSTRHIPLDLSKLWHIPAWGVPSITFELLAEGYRRVVNVPVDFTLDGHPRFNIRDQPDWL
jgi:hypothetical protein